MRPQKGSGLSQSGFRYSPVPFTLAVFSGNCGLYMFLRFCELILKSKKKALKTVFGIIRRNVNSVTGRNLRKIMFMTGKSDISELSSDDINNIEYKPVPIDEEWRKICWKNL